MDQTTKYDKVLENAFLSILIGAGNRSTFIGITGFQEHCSPNYFHQEWSQLTFYEIR